jgi:hypothetical protein
MSSSLIHTYFFTNNQQRPTTNFSTVQSSIFSVLKRVFLRYGFGVPSVWVRCAFGQNRFWISVSIVLEINVHR